MAGCAIRMRKNSFVRAGTFATQVIMSELRELPDSILYIKKSVVMLSMATPSPCTTFLYSNRV